MRPSVLLFAAAVMLVPAQAQSQEAEGWYNRVVGYNSHGTALYARVYCRRDGRCHRQRPQAYAHHRGTRVYSYVRREGGDEGGGGVCRDIRRAVGDQHLTVDGAKKAANDAWAGTVRFHLGEKWMSLENARDIIYTCSRSSIKEGGVTTLGQSLTRCEIEAQPCHPQRQIEANEK